MNTIPPALPTPDPAVRTVVALWDEQRVRTPQAAALLWDGQTISYADLNARVNQLARHLQTLGVGPDVRVGLCVERSPDMAAAVLGILKAGGAYVPLDPAYPAERLKLMLSGADAGVLLTQSSLLPTLPAHPQTLCLDTHWPASESTDNLFMLPAASDLCYVLYTSGSTGVPKGVAMEHGALFNLIQWQAQNSDMGAGDRTLQFASLSFDVSFQEMWATWATGGTVVLIPDTLRRDPRNLLRLIERERINRLFLPFVALQTLASAVKDNDSVPAFLREVMTAGEQLRVTPQITEFFRKVPQCVLFNQYGPSETHVVTQFALTGTPDTWPALPPIGTPISNTEALVLDENLQVVPAGTEGELFLGGACLARGYLNQPDLTAQRFLPHPFRSGERVYKTGDRTRLLPDGNIDFLGRADGQVKVRGFRVEVGEVEHALAQHPSVKQCAVTAQDDALCAYMVTDTALDPAVLRQFVSQSLPPYMVPSRFVRLDSLPLTPSGKVDRRALTQATPSPTPPPSERERGKKELPPFSRSDGGEGRGEGARETSTSFNNWQDAISAIWQDLLHATPGLHDNFFDLGGTSLLMVQVQARLTELTGTELGITTLFQFPTVASLATHLEKTRAAIQPPPAPKFGGAGEEAHSVLTPPELGAGEPSAPLELGLGALSPTPLPLRTGEPGGREGTGAGSSIAIVGMAGRFPGAPDIGTFWHNLTHGIDSITHFTEEQLRAAGVPEASLSDPNYVRARAVLENADKFDAAFFGISPRDAEQTDPQHRLFLECAWQAMEHAGHAPGNLQELGDGPVGVWAGLSWNTYLLHHLLPDRKSIEDLTGDHQVGHYAVLTGNDKDYLPTRVSYKLGLTGPSVAVGTGCSSSLVAVCQAVEALRAGSCKMALAGGASLSFPQERGSPHIEGGMVSPDGACRPYDAAAAGTVFGGGVGVVVLRPLADALADGDTVYAVIRGAALGNDGAGKVSFTAPGVDGQADTIARAHRDAQIAPDTISYVEGHGTATPLGDPIEVAALTQAFRRGTDKSGFCVLGSVKGNVGHLEAAAGVTGLIKTALALHHHFLPPTLNYASPNPRIDFAHSPFYVSGQAQEWNADGPRRAGVSSFGVGGTNAHVVLEEAPAVENSSTDRPFQLLTLSAKTPDALDRAKDNLAAHFAACPDANVADAAFTLNLGRKEFAHRAAVVVRDASDAADALRDPKRVSSQQAAPRPAPIVFLFPGQGAQQINMGRAVYETEAIFRGVVDECARLLLPTLGADIRDVLYPAPDAEDAARETLLQTGWAQPALFVTEYALARLWQSWSVQPAALLGHSVGEWVAACLSGVFTLPDALHCLSSRAMMMQSLPGGAMLAVRLPAPEVQSLLTGTLSIAAVNSPALCVVSGPADEADTLQAMLEAKNVVCRRLHTSHAFHSAMMEPVLAPFAEIVSRVERHAPRIPYVSNLTAQWATEATANDPGYWARHLREAVRFSDGVAFLLSQHPDAVFLEVGPGGTLASLVRQHPAKTAANVILSSLDTAKGAVPEDAALLSALGRLWTAGQPVDWAAFHAGERRQRVALPTYPFAPTRHWVEPVKSTEAPQVFGEETPISFVPENETMLQIVTVPAAAQASRAERITEKLTDTLHEISGVPRDTLDPHTSFLELGFDSLFLTQAAQAFGAQFKTKITFRGLLEDTPTLASLSEYLDAKLPADALPAPAPVQEAAAPKETYLLASQVPPAAGGLGTNPAPPLPVMAGASALERVMAQQLQVMSEQLALLRGTPVQAEQRNPSPALPETGRVKDVSPTPLPQREGTGVGSYEPKAFGPFKPIEKGTNGALTARQQAYVDDLVARTVARTPKSKAYTAEHRPHLSDPRVVAGFKSAWKEMVYPIVAERSDGAYLWDVDGNRWTDITMGFGVCLFGHKPAFITGAVQKQLELGVEIGPQSPLAGDVARRICTMTDTERVTFCNTGSEAVMAAIRAARTVTGRRKIVYFTGDYHGTFDEVLARANHVNGQLKSAPIAPGIPPGMVEDTLILEYGTPDSLRIIADHAEELAAILVEPVQSRKPDLQPGEFLRALRQIATDAGAALILDEVITGFRIGTGGAQAHFGVKADLVTYGKIIGGGMPFGLVAGRAEYLDAFDGGQWNYGDDSFPEVGVTFFAGTFVRHPLALAAAQAVLDYFDAHPSLQADLNARTEAFTERVNQFAAERGVPMRLPHFGSLFYFKFAPELKWAALFFYELRARGIHVWEGRPCFLSTAHTDNDLEQIARAFEDAIVAAQDGGIFPAPPSTFPVRGVPLRGEDSPHLPAPSPASGRRGAEGANLAPPLLALASGDAERAAGAGGASLALTPPQREVWLAAQMGTEANCALIESLTVRLNGPLDVNALQAAVRALPARHESLRTTFAADGETQTVHPVMALEAPLVDVSTWGAEAQQAAWDDLLAREAGTPFDLENGPLVRVQIVCFAEDRHTLVFSAHHLVCDGWSSGIVLSELGALYTAAMEGNTADLPAPATLAEYAARPANREDEQWWRETLTPLPDALRWPADRPRPAQPSYQGAMLTRALPPELSARLRKLGAKHGSTLLTTLLAAYAAFLSRMTGQNDIIIGVPTAGQQLLENDNLVGHCVHLLPLRLTLTPGTTFSDLLAQTRRVLLDAADHQDCTFSELLPTLPGVRDAGRGPLICTTFNVDRLPPGLRFGPLTFTVETNPRQAFQFDLGLNVVEQGADALLVEAHFGTDLFDPDTITRWLGHYETLLTGAAESPTLSISRLPLLTDAEQERILTDANHVVPYPRDETIHGLFARQARLTPDAPALVFGVQTITYGELDKRADSLARHLHTRGVGPDTAVGLCAERSVETVVALLAILKAGGAYVPLDPAYPAERLAFMVRDAQLQTIVTQAALAERLPSGPAIVLLDGSTGAAETDTPLPAAGAENLAYVIYTSGSTGMPKGVLTPHRAVVRLVQSQNYAAFGPGETFLHMASLPFDASTFEIWGPLLSGGKLVIAPPGPLSVQEIGETIARHGVTTLWLTAGLFHAVADEAPEVLRPVRHLLAGGDALSVPHVRKVRALLPDLMITNGYGPTECTTFACCHSIAAADIERASVSIGRPIANTESLVLDDNLQLVPIGVDGELYLGGDGLAHGYLGQPVLTVECFLPHPFRAGERLYKTGDRVRLLPSGDIDFLGRADGQVKVRGFRVEVGEVEHALAQHPTVKQVTVMADGDTLTAYMVTDTALDPAVLRQFVSQSLPPYMVPSRFVTLDSLPLTPSGKVDRRILASRAAPQDRAMNYPSGRPSANAPSRASASRTGDVLRTEGGLSSGPAGPIGVRAPQTGNSLPGMSVTQDKLAALWQSVLNVPQVGPHDNFFDLGGHSLLAVRLLVQVERTWGVRLALPALLSAPTVAQMAALLADKLPAVAPSVPVSDILVPLQTRGTETPLVCVHHIDGNVICYREMAQSLAPHQPVYGLQAPALTRPVSPPTRVEDMAAEFVAELVRALPDGPYRLCGYSFGGVVALEMAQQLRAQGREVSLLALLDTYAPVAFRDNLIEKPALQRLPVHLRRMGEQGARGIFSYAAQKAREARTDIGSHFPPEPGEAGFLPAAMAAIKTASEAALRAYVPQPYAGRTVLLRATELDPFENYDPRLWWGETFTGGLEIVDVPGPHLQMLRAPFVSTLAARLAALLHKTT